MGDEANRAKTPGNARVTAPPCVQCGQALTLVDRHSDGMHLKCNACGFEMAAPAAEAAPSVTHVGRYAIKRELGRGGMGVVYEAFDPTLKRVVALKLLRATGFSRDEVARLNREAAIAARLQHPNIVRVHEVGRVEQADDLPVHYIVMDFIDGRMLSDLIEDSGRPLKDLVAVVRDAALGIGFAHSKRVVHRDVKPQNIMVDTAGRAFVMDFGLARQREAGHSTLTMTGAVMGTPAYMSPEQARGDMKSCDARSDVYSIGVTLYEVLTRRVPFQGEDMVQILRQIVEEDVVAPSRHNSAVPRDLEAIVLKCLEKEPGRRYENAVALAADLTRYLDGEPVTARSPGLVYKLLKKLVRHRSAALATAGVAAAFAIVAAMQWGRARLEAELLGQMQGTSQACLDAALALRRSGNVAGMQAYADRVTAACRDVMERLPRHAEPHYQRGRMLRAQMRDAEAVKAQDEALARDPGHELARYERGLLVADAYRNRILDRRKEWWRRRLSELGGESAASVQDPTYAELEDDEARALKAKACGDLTGLSPPLARALVAYLNHDRPGAKKILEAGVSATPDDEMMWDWLAALANSEKEYERELEWYSRGLACDRGYVVLWLGRAGAHVRLAMDDRSGSPDVAKRFEAAVADYSEAIRIAPADADVVYDRGHTYQRWADWSGARGENPAPLYEAALKDLNEAIRVRPHARGYALRGVTHLNAANHANDFGQNPTKQWAIAVSDFQQSAALETSYPEAWFNWGMALSRWAGYEASHGGEPAVRWTEAIEKFTRAIQLEPRRAPYFHSRAAVRTEWARYRAERHEESAALRNDAFKDYDESIRLDPRDDTGWMFRGALHLSCGESIRAGTGDPTDHYAAALADFDKAVELRPAKASNLRARGSLRVAWGLYVRSTGADPAALFGAGLADIDAALRLNPKESDTLKQRATARELIGRYAEAIEDYTALIAADPTLVAGYRGRADALANIGDTAGAMKDLAKALEIDPRSSTVYLKRAYLHKQGGDFRACVADCTAALEHAPKDGSAYLLRGSARYELDEYEEAVKDFTRAIELNPAEADAWDWRGTARRLLGQFPAAIEDFTRAVELNPRDGRFRIRRAHALYQNGDPAGCVADCTKGLETAPNDAFGYKLRGGARIQLNEYAEALMDYTKSMELNPKDLTCYEHRAWLHEKLGTRASALADLKQLLSLAPADWPKRASVEARVRELSK